MFIIIIILEYYPIIEELEENIYLINKSYDWLWNLGQLSWFIIKCNKSFSKNLWSFLFNCWLYYNY